MGVVPVLLGLAGILVMAVLASIALTPEPQIEPAPKPEFNPRNPNGILPQDVRRRQRNQAEERRRKGEGRSGEPKETDYKAVAVKRDLAMVGALMCDPAFLDEDFEAHEFSVTVHDGDAENRVTVWINHRLNVKIDSETYGMLFRISTYDDGLPYHSPRLFAHFTEAQERSATLRAALRFKRADLATRAAEALRDVLISVQDEYVAAKAYEKAIQRINSVRTAIGSIPLALDWRDDGDGHAASVNDIGDLRVSQDDQGHAATVFGRTIPLRFETSHAAKVAAENEARRIARQTTATLGEATPKAPKDILKAA